MDNHRKHFWMNFPSENVKHNKTKDPPPAGCFSTKGTPPSTCPGHPPMGIRHNFVVLCHSSKRSCPGYHGLAWPIKCPQSWDPLMGHRVPPHPPPANTPPGPRHRPTGKPPHNAPPLHKGKLLAPSYHAQPWPITGSQCWTGLTGRWLPPPPPPPPLGEGEPHVALSSYVFSFRMPLGCPSEGNTPHSANVSPGLT